MPPRPNRTTLDLEAEVAAAVALAHHFTCTILSDRRYLTFRFDTLAEARAFQPQLEQAAANHRKAIVYAVTPTGSTVMVPDGF